MAGGLFGRLYAATFYAFTGVFGRLGSPKWLKPALAGLVVGALRGSVLVAVHRGNAPADARPDTQLRAGELVSVLVRRGHEEAVRTLLTNPTAESVASP